MLVYTRYVRSLDRDELNRLWDDYRVVGRRFGLRERDMPRDIDGFEAYMAGMYASGDLYVTDEARELAIDIVLRPPVPAAPAATGRIGEPDHGRLVAERRPPPVRLLVGSSARRSPAGRRGVRQARCCANRGSSRYWTTSAMKLASTIRITPSRIIASITGTSPFLATV